VVGEPAVQDLRLLLRPQEVQRVRLPQGMLAATARTVTVIVIDHARLQYCHVHGPSVLALLVAYSFIEGDRSV
jgi:hypothetical protein